MRKTSWSFTTKQTLHARNICLAGVFLSCSERCCVFCSSKEKLTGKGEAFCTRDRLLADALHESSQELTLGDVLWEASDHVSDPAKKNPPVLSDFLLEVEKSSLQTTVSSALRLCSLISLSLIGADARRG